MLSEGPFHLTTEMIARGRMTAEEMTAFSGIPVVFTDHRVALARIQEGQRLKAHPLGMIEQGPLSPSMPREWLDVHPPLHTQDFFMRALEAGTARNTILNPPLSQFSDGRPSRYVCLLPESHARPIKAEYIRHDATTPDHFARYALFQPLQKLQRIPDLALYDMGVDLHEFAHSMQLGGRSDFDPDVDLRSWLEEGHADLFQISAQEAAGIPRDKARETLFWRYAGLFFPFDSSHYTSPVLECLLENKPALSYQKVLTSVREIHLHLAQAYQGKDSRDLSRGLKREPPRPGPLGIFGRVKGALFYKKAEKLTAKYTALWDKKFYTEGERFTTLLDSLCLSKAFSSSLTQHIAERMVESMCHFNPSANRADISAPRRVFPAAVISG